MSNKTVAWLNTSAKEAAQRLLGCELVCTINGETVRVKIVETEAYDQTDEASHTYRGRTRRNDAMFLAAGHMYVYFTYGMHHCCNVVCGEEGFGAGVLLRAVEPIEGLDVIEKRRNMTGVNITNGPGKVCAALEIDTSYSGHDLLQAPIQLIKRPAIDKKQIIMTTRIGITKAASEIARFYIKNNQYVSRK